MSDVVARLNAALAGRYVVRKQVGAGGMATVYLADDLKHDRTVALKVLKPELAAVVGAERFLAEIKVTAGLQHPNILPLFDSGEADSFLFYVMPFIDGESLRDRLDRERQLPVSEAVRITISVANALDHAHRRGVVHRDIKPANIMLQDGEPVVADFGIALAVGASQGRLTETGLSVGTPFYMSPEQATGDRVISPSSDTYSLACVLYELLAGEPPHGGGTAQAVLGRIITGAPTQVRERRPTVPEHIDGALRKALERIPPDRFETAGAFATALADEGFRYGDAPAPLPVSHAAVYRLATFGLLGVSAVALAVAGWALTRESASRPARVLANELTLGPGAPERDITRAAASSDGSVLVYTTLDARGVASLFVRGRDEITARPVPGTEGARNVAISPSGEDVAYTGVAVGPLRVVSLAGGEGRVLTDRAQAGVPVWSAEHIYFTNPEFGLSRVPILGGDTERLLPPEDGVVRYPMQILPGGEELLFTETAAGGDRTGEIKILTLVSGEVSSVAQGSNAQYIDGLLIYASPGGDQILGAPFDPESLRLSPPGIALVSGLSGSGALRAAAAFSVSESGDLVYPAGGTFTRSRTTPLWVDRTGTASRIDPDWRVSPVVSVSGLALSHDGTRLAVSSQAEDGSLDIWVKDLRGGPAQRLTVDPRVNSRPFWAPDDDEIYYFRDRAGSYLEGHLLAIPSDGSDRPREVLADVGIGSGSWGVGHEWMIFRVGVPARESRDVYGLRGGAAEPVALVATPATEQAPSLSPDGRWLLYQSDRLGEHNVFVRPFPGVDEGLVQVSLAGGTEPRWARSGTEIFYRDADGQMVSAQVDGDTGFRVTARDVLFDASAYWSDPAAQQYDVAPDDQRFIMLERQAGSGSMVVIWNWLDGVKARLREEGRLR